MDILYQVLWSSSLDPCKPLVTQMVSSFQYGSTHIAFSLLKGFICAPSNWAESACQTVIYSLKINVPISILQIINSSFKSLKYIFLDSCLADMYHLINYSCSTWGDIYVIYWFISIYGRNSRNRTRVRTCLRGWFKGILQGNSLAQQQMTHTQNIPPGKDASAVLSLSPHIGFFTIREYTPLAHMVKMSLHWRTLSKWTLHASRLI